PKYPFRLEVNDLTTGSDTHYFIYVVQGRDTSGTDVTASITAEDASTWTLSLTLGGNSATVVLRKCLTPTTPAVTGTPGRNDQFVAWPKCETSMGSPQTAPAGAADTVSAWVDINTGYGAQVNFQLTNGGTGPTVAAQVQVEFANDTAHTLPVKFGGPLVGTTTNSAVSSWSVELPIGVCSVRLRAGSNTVQNVTVDADISNVTGI